MKSISTLFRQLSLIVALISAFSLSAWGEEIVIDIKTDNSNIFNFQKSNQISEHTITSNDIVLGYKSCYYSGNNNDHYIMFCKSAGTFYNKTNLGKINSITLTYSSGTSEKGFVNVFYGSTAITERATTNYNEQLNVKKSNTVTSTPQSNVGFFNLSVHNSNNIQITKIVINYTPNSSGAPSCIDPEISFTETTVTKTNGEGSFTNTLTTNSSGAVTYTSSKTTVAEVANDGEVTINGVGTTIITATVTADDTYCEGSASYTLTVNGRDFNITWMNGEEEHETTTYTEGTTLTLPATDPTSCSSNYSYFAGWYSAKAGTTSSQSTSLDGLTEITAETKPEYNANGVTYYAVFGSNNTSATAETASIDFSAQNYTNQQTITSCEIGDATVSFNKGSNSNAPKYYTSGTAIRVYGGNYFTISSETTISDITLTFGSSDGSNAITTDCGTYSNGIWTGSANSVKFTIGGSTGNRRIKEIKIEFESSASSAYISTCDGEEVVIPNAPVFNVYGGDFTENQIVTITAEDGATIYYTTNGEDPTTESSVYTEPIEIATTTTLKAIAVLDGVESNITEAEYRIHIVDDIAAFISAEPTVETKISGEVVVTAISEKQDVIWIEDNFGAIMVYGVSNKSNYKVGDAFSGVKGLYENYNGLPEIKDPIFPNEKGVGEPSNPEKVTIFSVKNDILLNKLVKIENVIYTNKVTNNNGITTRTFIDADDETINSYDSHFSAQDININDKVNLTAIVGKYNTQYQLYIISAERVKEPTISVSVSELDFGDVVENKELSKSTTITTVDLGESASVSISGVNASCFAVNTNKIEDNSETEITITFTTPDVDVETKCTATLTITGGGQTKEIALTATVKPLLALTANINGIPIPQEVGTFAEGDDITTALNAIDVTAPEGWSFAGWVANAIDGSQTATPEYLTTMPAKATIAYAVFKLGKEQIFTETLSASTANYTSNSGYCEFTATSTSGTWKGTANYVKDKEYIQINAEKGYILSTNFAGNVNSIKITTTNTTLTDRTFYINSNSITGKPTSGDLGSHKTTTVDEEFTINLTSEAKRFYIYSSGAVYISKIEVTYDASGYTYRTSITSREVTSKTTINESTINSLTIYSNATTTGEVVATSDINVDIVTLVKTIGQTWCFFSLPYDCNVADVVATASDTTLTYAPNENDGSYVIAEYNGGWVELLGTSHTLNANQGYIIGQFTDNTEVTVKFPSNGAQTISTPTTASVAKTSNNDFNLIGLPYYQKVNAELNVEYLSIPNEDGMTYNQTDDHSLLSNIAPFSSFFVETVNNIEFTIAAQQNAAPMMRANGVTNKAVVTLTDANGGVDKTTIINNPNNTTDYEIGHDLTKLIGYASIPQIYSLQGDEMLAFNSLAIDNSTVIPLGVYAHADGEYTFALNENSLGDIQGWELYDNETGKTTRLANENLTIYLEQGTHEGRFEIRLQQRITTNCDNSMGDMTTWTANGTLNINNMPADAVVYIYDAVGRMIYVATPNANTFNYSFVARGVYNIVVRSADNTVSFKTIY